MALKGNQSGIHGMLKAIFDKKIKGIPPSIEGFKDKEYSRGRREIRYFRATEYIGVFVKNYEFSGLKTATEITYERISKEKIVTEKRYYISSLFRPSREITEDNQISI